MIDLSDPKNLFERLDNLECEYQTRSYIIGIFNKHLLSVDGDLSKENIILLFADASAGRNFVRFQKIGDWVFFCKTIFPEFLPEKFYGNLAQLSYFHCYKILDRKWKSFEELADRFDNLEYQTRFLLSNIRNR